MREKNFSSLKCVYTNVHAMGNKREEQEICMWSRGYDLTAVTETWWDSSHDWNAVMEGCVLFRQDWSGRQGGGIVLYVRATEMHETLPRGEQRGSSELMGKD